MLRRDFVRAVVAVSLAPKLLLSQQQAALSPPPAPVPWTLGLNPKTPLPLTDSGGRDRGDRGPLLYAAADGRPSRVSAMCFCRRSGTSPARCRPTHPASSTSSSAARRRPAQAAVHRRSGLAGGGVAEQIQAALRAARRSAQADALLKPWLRTWMTDHPPTEPHADFINIAHEDIRTATMNSKAWNDASLGGGAGLGNRRPLLVADRARHLLRRRVLRAPAAPRRCRTEGRAHACLSISR